MRRRSIFWLLALDHAVNAVLILLLVLLLASRL